MPPLPDDQLSDLEVLFLVWQACYRGGSDLPGRGPTICDDPC